MFPVVPIRVVKLVVPFTVNELPTIEFPAKFPVIDRLDIVVEASVEEPDTERFASVAELIDSVLAPKFPVTVRLLTVVEARVELPEVIKLVTFSVPTFDVEAFVVEANKVVRYEVEVANT
jgi:hypothetical protein